MKTYDMTTRCPDLDCNEVSRIKVELPVSYEPTLHRIYCDYCDLHYIIEIELNPLITHTFKDC